MQPGKIPWAAVVVKFRVYEGPSRCRLNSSPVALSKPGFLGQRQMVAQLVLRGYGTRQRQPMHGQGDPLLMAITPHFP
jgi:hypothetical protein